MLMKRLKITPEFEEAMRRLDATVSFEWGIFGRPLWRRRRAP
jgi:hypothetical protein